MYPTKKMIGLLILFIVTAAISGCRQEEQEKYTILTESFGIEEYGVAFRKTDARLCEEVQKHLNEMIEDGTAGAISQKWFGDDVLLRKQVLPQTLSFDGGDHSLTKVKEAGKLVLGYDEKFFFPMGYEENGQIVGFDIDLAAEVAKRMGVELVTVPIDWDAQVLLLSGGEVDMIWNGLTIKPSRLESMLFSKPYLANRQAVVVRGGSTIASRENLKNKTVGVIRGSLGAENLKKDRVTSAFLKETKEYDDLEAAFADLNGEIIDALLADEILERSFIVTEKNKAEAEEAAKGK